MHLLPAHSNLTHLDLFSGIGGFALGLEGVGRYNTVAFCDSDPFCRHILQRHWPAIPRLKDVYDVTAATLIRKYRIHPRDIDLITAGFPCQPFSSAGRRQGTADERYLWDALYQVIFEVRPRYLILENVPHIVRIQDGLVLRGILRCLAALGYVSEWDIIPASRFGAAHYRRRWILVGWHDLANPYGGRRWNTASGQCSDAANGNAQIEQPASQYDAPFSAGEVLEYPSSFGIQGQEFAGRSACGSGDAPSVGGHRPQDPIGDGGPDAPGASPQQGWAASQSSMGGIIDGLPRRLDAAHWDVSRPDQPQAEWESPRLVDPVPYHAMRLHALGNAVFPPMIRWLGQRLWEFHNGQRGSVLFDPVGKDYVS